MKQAELLKKIQEANINGRAFLGSLSKNLPAHWGKQSEDDRCDRVWALIEEVKDDAEKLSEIAIENGFSGVAQDASHAIGHYVAKNF